MSLLVRSDLYAIHITPIPTESDLPRRRQELSATETLITEAFGPTATLGHTTEGAPYLTDSPTTPLSISHSENNCILAVGLSPYINIGVDIETPRQQLLRIAERFLCEQESRIVRNISDENERLRTLLEFWTAKEAVYKAALTPGLGLKEISVSPDLSEATARGIKFNLHRHPLLTGEEITVALRQP